MLITTENFFQQCNNISVFYDTKTHFLVQSLRLHFTSIVNLCSDSETFATLMRSVMLFIVMYIAIGVVFVL